MKRLLSLLGCLFASSALHASGAEVELRLWAPELSGWAQVADGSSATVLDFARDLGFADEELLSGRLVWNPTRRTSVRFSWSSFEFSGDEMLQRSLSFGGSTFDLEARVLSRLDLDYGGVGIGWQFLSTRDGRHRFGPMIEARGIRGETALETDLLGLLPISAGEEFELGFAAAGLLLDLEPTRKLHLHAEWRTAIETDEGDLTDAEAALRYLLFDSLALTAGFRWLEIRYEDGSDSFDLELEGPFFGAMLRF